ncbi:MAG: pitrilysin family protein, partial [Pseudomonadota bacterium]
MAFSAAGDSAETPGAWSPDTFTLDNGMEVLILPDHRAPVVTHMVWYKVGAVDEDPGKSGIAHLFEHVMFKETDDIGPEEFSSIVQRSGGQLNAFTSWDYTAYFERVEKSQLGLMMELEAERMTDLIINDDPDGPFISERDVVKEERRQRIENNPGALPKGAEHLFLQQGAGIVLDTLAALFLHHVAFGNERAVGIVIDDQIGHPLGFEFNH